MCGNSKVLTSRIPYTHDSCHSCSLGNKVDVTHGLLNLAHVIHILCSCGSCFFKHGLMRLTFYSYVTNVICSCDLCYLLMWLMILLTWFVWLTFSAHVTHVFCSFDSCSLKHRLTWLTFPKKNSSCDSRSLRKITHVTHIPLEK